jgi:hypothetical protein
MGTMFFMLAVIVIVPLAIIVWAVNEVCSALEGRSIFHGVIPEDRAKFFQETFGLTVDEMGQFHFDGCLFHVGNGVPYWELKSITCTEVRDVSVVNSQLPHTSSWQHERVNGGPDRRYKNNAITRTSRRFQLLFVAASEYRFVIYSQPSSYYASKVNDALQKINKFLAISQIIDLEASFNEYSKAFHIIQETRSRNSPFSF